MFETLEFQYLNKLVKGEVRDFSTPEAFHAVKVERLGGDKVKPSAEVSGKFPMPISALVGDMPIQSCELTHTSPPVVRAFDFTAECLVQFPKLVQRLFQKLWRLYFLAIAQCQKCVFHTEVCTYTFTRSLQRFSICVVSCDTKPIITARVAFDGDSFLRCRANHGV